ncbi:MAG: prepilin-type N-terminal cleavage/methylation domain-containing protein [Pirellulales bacterium]|nr:prepilin-type N-terminal cleavage/methylation domain-containing protein [Pirellulales bacterium]
MNPFSPPAPSLTLDLTTKRSTLLSSTKPRSIARTAGFSLLEVLLAIAILGMSLVVISGLVIGGLRNIESSQYEVQAALIAESKLSEIASGIMLPESVANATYENDSNWVYTVNVEQTDVAGLLTVQVIVARNVPDNQPNYRAVLSQWMCDPAVVEQEKADRQAELDAIAQQKESAASSSGSSSSSGGSNTGSNSGGGS